MEITSTSNKLVKYADSLKNRSVRQKEKSFLVEGRKLIEEAIKSGFEPYTVFVNNESKYEFDELKLNIEPVYVPYNIIKKLSRTTTPQGLIAIFKMKDFNEKKNNLNSFVILENIQDPGNFGTILRTAEAFGIDGVITVGDTVDIYNPKVLRGSMGSAFRILHIHFSNCDEAFDFFKSQNVKVFAGVLSKRAKKITDIDFKGKIGVAVGNEGNGLTHNFISKCEYDVYIPMSGKTESLNAATAAAIMMWELYKRRSI